MATKPPLGSRRPVSVLDFLLLSSLFFGRFPEQAAALRPFHGARADLIAPSLVVRNITMRRWRCRLQQPSVIPLPDAEQLDWTNCSRQYVKSPEVGYLRLLCYFSCQSVHPGVDLTQTLMEGRVWRSLTVTSDLVSCSPMGRESIDSMSKEAVEKLKNDTSKAKELCRPCGIWT